MSKSFKFVIKGDPFGKLNMQPMNIRGHARAFNPHKNVEYMGRVIDVLDKAPDKVAFAKGEEVWISITAFFSIPKQHYKYHKRTGTTDLDKTGQLMKEHKIRPTKKPDLDNISKVICDAISKQGTIWYDDSQITCEVLMKFYDEHPRVEVVLEKAYGTE